MVSLNPPQIDRNAPRDEKSFDWLYETKGKEKKEKREGMLKSGDRRFRLIRCARRKKKGKQGGKGLKACFQASMSNSGDRSCCRVR